MKKPNWSQVNIIMWWTYLIGTLANCVLSCLSQSIQWHNSISLSSAVSPLITKLSRMVITTQPDLIINQYVVSSALIGHIRPTCHPAVNIGKKKLRDPKVILCSRGDCCAKTQIDSKLNNFPPNIHSCALFPKNYLRIPTFLPLFCNWNPAVPKFCLFQ